MNIYKMKKNEKIIFFNLILILRDLCLHAWFSQLTY